MLERISATHVGPGWKGALPTISHRIWVGSPYNPRDLCAAKDKVKDVKILPDFKMHPPTHPSLSQLLGNIFGNHRREHTQTASQSPWNVVFFYSCGWLKVQQAFIQQDAEPFSQCSQPTSGDSHTDGVVMEGCLQFSGWVEIRNKKREEFFFWWLFS